MLFSIRLWNSVRARSSSEWISSRVGALPIIDLPPGLCRRGSPWFAGRPHAISVGAALGRDKLACQALDTLADLVTNGTNGVDVKSGWVLKYPVFVARAGEACICDLSGRLGCPSRRSRTT